MITLFLSIISLFYLTTYIIYIDKFDSTFKKVPKLKFINQLFQLYSNHLLINRDCKIVCVRMNNSLNLFLKTLEKGVPFSYDWFCLLYTSDAADDTINV